MPKCPACQAVADDRAVAAGHCSQCGAALHRVPQRTIQDVRSQQTVDVTRPVDLDTIGDVESLDIELIEGSKSSPDTIRTLELSTQAEFSTADPDLGATLQLGAEKTIAFSTHVENPALAESMATAAWEDVSSSQGTNSRFTIKQEESEHDSQTTRSSVVVKSRQFRSTGPTGTPAPGEAPDYELLDVIGEGGMGVVYSARQSAIARTVAVKMLKKRDAESPEQREKFISEAVVTGELDHPNIVPIYDLGANDAGALFYSMKRVKGTPWDDVLPKKPLDENLNILLRVADAVAFAHANGVIHRDLKPENVMLGDYGEVLVMDWGLARISPDFPNAASVSQSNVMGGTPAYMSPEMATGPIELITTASDVYLLGAILYEIISGKPPHSGNTVMACLMAAAKNQIPVPDHSTELSGIALKAMASKSEDRYSSVREFQDAIRDYQAHSESILLTESAEQSFKQAVEKGDYELFSRALYGFEEALTLWDGNERARRLLASTRFSYAEAAYDRADFDLGISLLDPDNGQHRVLLKLLEAGQNERDSRERRLRWLKRTVAGLLLAVGAIVSAAFVIVRAERDEAVTQRIRAEEAEDVAQKNYETAEAERVVAEKAREAEAQQRELAEKAEAAAIAAKNAEEYEAYVARIGLANAKIEENAFDRAQQLLDQCNPKFTNWEWGRLAHLCNLSEKTWDLAGPVEAVAYSPDGQLFATGDLTGHVRLFDVTSGEEVMNFSAGQYVHDVAFAPDGLQLAAGSSDGIIRIFDISTQQESAQLVEHTDAVLSVEFSKDGTRLLSAGYDNTAKLWDVSTNRVLQTLIGHNWWVWSADFSSNERRIVTASQDGKVLVWELDEANGKYRIFTEFSQHRGPVYGARFSPDGKLVASVGYDRRVLVWNPDEIHPVDIARRLDGSPDLPAPFVEVGVHDGPIRCLDFSPDGIHLATGGQDNLIRIWNLVTGAEQAQLRGHASHVRACHFSPEGGLLLSAGRDGLVKSWQPSESQETIVLNAGKLGDAILAAHFSADGQKVVTASRDRTATLWSLHDRDVLQQFSEGHEFLASRCEFFAGGSRLATSAGDGSVRIWDVYTGTQMLELDDTGSNSALAVSDDGRWLFTGSSGSDAVVWDAQDGSKIATLPGHEAPVTAIAFSPSGNQLATGDDRGLCGLWQWDEEHAMWELLHWLRGHSRTITALGFARPDLLVSASGDNTCGLWDTTTGQELRSRVLKHPNWVSSMDLSADGSLALTGCDDGRLRLWALDDSRMLATFEPSEDAVVYTGIDLAPDGEHALATCAAHGEIFLLDLAKPTSGTAPQVWKKFPGKGGIVWAAQFAPSGEEILTIGGNDARLWNTDSGALVESFSPHGAVADAEISPDGTLVATGSWDRSAKIWNARTGQSLRKLEGVHTGYINSIEFSPDGNTLLTASDDGSAHLWDVATGKLQKVSFSGHEGRVYQARFDAEGKKVVTCSGDKTARIWDVQTGAVLQTLTGHEWAVLCGQFSPDGKLTATGGEDNVAILWDSNTGEQLRTFAGHTDSITAVAFSADGSRLATGSQDNSIKLWDTYTGKEILTLSGHSEEITSLEFSPDGLTILSSGRDGKSMLWTALPWGER